MYVGAAEAGVDACHAYLQEGEAVGQVATHILAAEGMALVGLFLRAVEPRFVDGGNGISAEAPLQRAVGVESQQLQAVDRLQLDGSTPEVAVFVGRAVRGDGGVAEVGGGERIALAVQKARANAEAQTQVKAVVAQCQLVQPAVVADEQVGRIGVITLAVIEPKERFAGILLGGQTQLDVVAISIAVAQGVVDGRAEVVRAITFAAVEGDVDAALQAVVTPVEQLLGRGEVNLLLGLADAEVGEDAPDELPAQSFHYIEFVERLHGPILGQVIQYIGYVVFV